MLFFDIRKIKKRPKNQTGCKVFDEISFRPCSHPINETFSLLTRFLFRGGCEMGENQHLVVLDFDWTVISYVLPLLRCLRYHE